MNEQHGGCALADTGCDSFDGSMANVACCEYSGNAAFQPERISFQRPALRTMAVSAQLFQVGPGQDESVVIRLHDAFEILRVRKTTDKDEKRMRWYGFFLLRGTVQYGDCLKPLSPCTSATSHRKRTLILGVALICSMRYCDIDCESDSLLTSSVTVLT